MSVIVTGVHFPTGCSKCKFNHDAICVLIESCNYDETNGIARRPDCPLRPLPDVHGDLIDRDALPSRVEWEDIVNAPVVVKAEGQSEPLTISGTVYITEDGVYIDPDFNTGGKDG